MTSPGGKKVSLKANDMWNDPLNQLGHSDFGDLLEDWIVCLWKEVSSDEQADQVRIQRSQLISKISYMLCEKLKQPRGVWYHSLELFERFLFELFKVLEAHAKTASCEKKAWEELKARNKEQMLLRLVSCIQIASKINNANKGVNKKQAMEVINGGLRKFQLSTVVKSEVRVLDIVRFRVSPMTLLVYYETTFSAMALDLEKQGVQFRTDVKTTFDMGLQLLDLVYFTRDQLYEDFLAKIITDETVTGEEVRERFEVVVRDRFLMAAAIIHAASVTVKPSLLDAIENSLWRTVGIDPSDFAVLSGCIVRSFLEN